MVASIGQTSLPGFLNLFLKVMRGDPVKHDDVTKGLVLDTSLANMAPMMVSKPDASDPDLTAMLETWQEGNRLFTHIYLYKTSLTSASGGEESDVPNYIGVAHHEGVVMKHASEGGQPQYLKLDFGSDGLEHATTKDFPIIRNQTPWGEGHGKFKKARIRPEHGHPKRLIRVLELVKGKPYHALKWNCQSFADLMWQCFPEWNTAWVPDIFEIFQNVARKHNLLDEGNDDVSFFLIHRCRRLARSPFGCL